MSDELDRLARLAVRQKEEEGRKLAAMSPEERDRYIDEWAARVAPCIVEDGCAIDRMTRHGPPGGTPNRSPDLKAATAEAAQSPQVGAAIAALNAQWKEALLQYEGCAYWIAAEQHSCAKCAPLRALLAEGKPEGHDGK